MLQCFIFKITDSKQTVTMLQCIRTHARTRVRACRVRSSQCRAVPLYSHALVVRDRRLCRSVPEGLDTQEMSRISDGPLGLKRFFSLQNNTKHTYTCYITLLRIWPDVETFRMSFCGDPCSCSGSLSDDSASAAAAAPTAAILRFSPRDSHSQRRVPAGPAAQRRHTDRANATARRARERAPPTGQRSCSWENVQN